MRPHSFRKSDVAATLIQIINLSTHLVWVNSGKLLPYSGSIHCLSVESLDREYLNFLSAGQAIPSAEIGTSEPPEVLSVKVSDELRERKRWS